MQVTSWAVVHYPRTLTARRRGLLEPDKCRTAPTLLQLAKAARGPLWRFYEVPSEAAPRAAAALPGRWDGLHPHPAPRAAGVYKQGSRRGRDGVGTAVSLCRGGRGQHRLLRRRPPGRVRQHASPSSAGRALAAAVRAHGLRLTDWQGAALRLAPGRCASRRIPRRPRDADVVLVTVKSAATEDAGRQLARVLGPRRWS